MAEIRNAVRNACGFPSERHFELDNSCIWDSVEAVVQTEWDLAVSLLVTFDLGGKGAAAAPGRSQAKVR